LSHLVLVGISHRVAPVEVRERVAFDAERAAQVAAELAPAVCLSTCNRTELYLEVEDAAAARALLGELPGLYELSDDAAALHLFRVAGGLDSLVPGEGEILGQVRGAYEAGTPGPLLDRAFRQALHAGKRVRHETAIAESPSSVASAAAALAQQVFGDLAGKRVLLIGAGKTAEQAADNLRSRGAELVVANRTADKADVGLERIPDELPSVDIVVSATAAPEFVLRREDVGRRSRPLLVIDLAVPRDVEPSVGELEGCFLYDIDDLEGVVAATLDGRRSEAGRAEAIVAAEAQKFSEWRASLDVVPAIASLRARVEEIRDRELDRVRGRLSDAERTAVESVTARIVDKLLHQPTVRLKEAAAGAHGAQYAATVRHLFGLGEEERR
jgi:glutamyl-tRNA reductase